MNVWHHVEALPTLRPWKTEHMFEKPDFVKTHIHFIETSYMISTLLTEHLHLKISAIESLQGIHLHRNKFDSLRAMHQHCSPNWKRIWLEFFAVNHCEKFSPVYIVHQTACSEEKLWSWNTVLGMYSSLWNLAAIKAHRGFTSCWFTSCWWTWEQVDKSLARLKYIHIQHTP